MLKFKVELVLFSKIRNQIKFLFINIRLMLTTCVLFSLRKIQKSRPEPSNLQAQLFVFGICLKYILRVKGSELKLLLFFIDTWVAVAHW